MTLHELVTNAIKYGALSSAHGHVIVSWDRRQSDGAAAYVKIDWRETGGPPVANPVKLGYGTNLIRDMIPHELGGLVDLIFASDGVCCKIEVPIEQR